MDQFVESKSNEPTVIDFTDHCGLLNNPFFDSIKKDPNFIRFSLDIDTVEHTYLMVESRTETYRLGEVTNNCDLVLPTWQGGK